MHWLPLVAMVIASALPFPHNPATTQPGSGSRREDRRDPAALLAAPPVDYSLRGNASRTDDSTAAALSSHIRQNLKHLKDYVKSSTREETSMFKVGNEITYQTFSNSGTDDRSRVSLDVAPGGGTLRTEDISKDNSLQTNYIADSSNSRKDSSSFLEFSKTNTQQDFTHTPIEASTAENYDVVSPATMLKGQRGPEPTASSRQVQKMPTTRTGARTGPAKDRLTLEAGLSLGAGIDSLLEGDDIFMDTHPRVLFSPSPSPPEHPPPLLLLESDLLEEERDKEEQEDQDGHIEGHGDRAIDRSSTPSWEDYSRVGSTEANHPVKRNKRSNPVDNRRGEKSVCESESIWVKDKKTAITNRGDNVTIIQEIQTQAGPVRQYFYETRCRQAEQLSISDRQGAVRSLGTGVAGAGCLGVDKKQWQSECKAKHSFVRALTKDEKNKIGWRWIRIDSSCVCVLLSRTNQKRAVLTGRGRG